MERLIRDGVALAYEERGSGEPPLVFLHGWCCDWTYFAPQVAHFAARHRVVAPDLRGHGASDQPDQDYTIPGFADDVAWVLEQLRLDGAVLVGHSMGGIIAVDVAARYPARVAAVVALDSALAIPPVVIDAIERFLPVMEGPDYRARTAEYIAQTFFLATDGAERRERIIAGMTSAPQRLMVSAMDSLAHYDSEAALAALTRPMLYIAANEAKPRSDVARLRQIVPHMLLGQTVGSGHFLMLEVPDQANAMIGRFLALLARGALSVAS